MSLRHSILMVILAGLLALWAWRLGPIRPDIPSAETRPLIFGDLSPGDIRSVRIRSGEIGIHLERRGSDWHLESPVPFPAEGARIRSMLRNLLDLRSRHRLVPGGDDSYGLEPPRLTLTLTREAGKAIVLEVGDKDAGVRFVRRRDTGHVDAVEREALSVLEQKTDHWRDARLLPFHPSRIVDFRHRGEGRIHLSRPSGGREWTMIDPVPGGRVDMWAFHEFLDSLSRLRGRDFGVPATGPARARWEFLLSDGTRWPVEIVAPRPGEPSDHLARLGSTGAPAIIPSAFVRQYQHPERLFRSPFLLDEGIRFDRIDVEAGERYELTLTAPGQWQLSHPETLETDPDLMQAFIRQLAELRIEQFVHDGPPETAPRTLGTPILSLAFSQGEQDPVILHLAPWRERLLLARRSDEADSLYAVRREPVLQLPDAGWKLTSRTPWDFDADTITGIRVLRPSGESRHWKRTPKGWRSGEILIDEMESERLGYHLHPLFTVHTWISRRPGAPLSSLIDTPVLTLELERENAPIHTLLLGRLHTTGNRLAAGHIRGIPTLFTYPRGILDPLQWSLLPRRAPRE